MKKREAVLEVFEKIHEQGHLACYWKSPQGLNDALDVLKKDVDLLCKREPKDLLLELGFKKFGCQERHQLRGVTNWVKPVEGGFCHLHVHERIYTGTAAPLTHRIPWVEYILHHCEIDSETGIPIPIPEVDFILLLTRYAFEKKITKEILRESIRRTTIEKVVEHTSLVLGKRRGKNLGQKLRKGIPSRKKIHSLVKNGLDEILSPTLSSGRVAARNARGISRVSYSRLKHDLLPDLRPLSRGLRTEERGLVVSVVGADGSGKSTLTSKLENWLKDLFDVHLVYFGRGDAVSATWQTLAKAKWALLGGVPEAKIEEGKVLDKMTTLEKRTSEKGVKRIVRNLSRIALAERKLRDSNWVSDARENGGIIITDRFPVTEFGLLDGAMIEDDGSTSQKIFSTTEKVVLGRLDLNPDIVFRLNIDPDIAWARKPDHNLEDIRAKTEALKKATFPHSNVIEIDATNTEQDILDMAKKVIWDAL